ncbi:LLM class flavin-dependent oxidoreductase [SAR202 cluster bacterium AD-804-J14_MRT_500m]|nr:LLM class flavin-dependent oxidoreductase [SAR202 cluster bacterium AD-804-J14_MRT_500m]
MFLMYFTEQPMSNYPEEEARKNGGTSALLFSNKHFDPIEGSRLYNERLEEYVYAEEMGVDGIMLNEHHNAPFCMQAKINVFASVLAATTKKVKIVLLGNPLPTLDNPLNAAEEIGMIDMLSQGRLVSGFVRGSGTEQYANNSNPAYNRERFEEAHDLLIKIWTDHGPFRWEGDHYQFRVVNPWSLPLQKPHPRIWIPGVASMETVVWSAAHRYPYICLNTTAEQTQAVFDIYDKTAREVGYEPGPENRGYLIRCHVSDTEEKAVQNAREFMWMQGEFTGLGHPVWFQPPGYSSPTSRRRRIEGQKQRVEPFETQLETGAVIAGTPDQVIEKLRRILEQNRPSILALWGNDGKVNHEDSMTCIRLMGQEVMPAVREIGDQLGLSSPFELDTPVSLAQTPAADLHPVSA